MMRDDNGPLLRKRREQWIEPLLESILVTRAVAVNRGAFLAIRICAAGTV